MKLHYFYLPHLTAKHQLKIVWEKKRKKLAAQYEYLHTS